MTAAEVTSKVYSITSAGPDASLIHVTFTKADVADFITLDTKYGDTCEWANVTKSTGAVDDATDITGTVVTLSAETGSMFGTFMVRH